MKFLLVGKKGCGKSTLLYSLFKEYDCGGIVCLPIVEEDKQVGKDAINMATHESTIFCRIKEKADFNGILIGKYIIRREAMDFCIKAFGESLNKKIIIIDEFGYLEMEEKGLYEIIKKILETDKNVIIALRQELEEAFLKKMTYKFITLRM